MRGIILKSKTKYSEKYWFAIGYHDAMRGVYLPPSKQLAEYLLENDIDIMKNYQHGHKAGVVDFGTDRSDTEEEYETE